MTAVLGLMAAPGTWAVSEPEMASLAEKLPPPASTPVDFDQHIRPIFENTCLRCHGPERPKGRFRLDTREDALKGGENGVDIVPGSSAKSPLIFYVARLVEDMEMPPAGKGEPLTSEQIATLRAWIDQGAKWSESATNAGPKLKFSITPELQWFSVHGNESKFREHTGIKEGWNGGAQRIYFEEQLPKNRKLTLDALIMANPEEYKFRLEAEQRDLGFVRVGAEKYREYYDDVGGYYPAFTPASQSLNRDLHLDVGRAWAEIGILMPDRPKMVFGYEYRYREGDKATLQWAEAGPAAQPAGAYDNSIDRLTFPASRSIDETVHVVKFDLTHEVNGIGIENNFRTEFYDNDTRRQHTEYHQIGFGGTEKVVTVQERQDHFQASDAFRLEKQILDWLYVSGGYFFSRLSGDYSFNAEPVSPFGILGPLDGHWFTDSIILEQTTHTFNANTQLGPWAGLSIYGGLQAEWMSQRGFGTVNLDEGTPGAYAPNPARLDADLDRAGVEEHVGLRYTGLPYTVVFAEGRLAQEDIGQAEQTRDVAQTYEFLRDTDASTQLRDARAGFTLSPWTRVSLTAQYKHRERDSDYDHGRDETPFGPNEGYSAFITGRELETDQVALKLAWRATSWLKTTFTYQKISSDYRTDTDICCFGANISPGGEHISGQYDADVYSGSFAVTPWKRLRLTSTVSYREMRTSTRSGLTTIVAPYDGDGYSVMSVASFVIDNKTDFNAGYTFSRADYAQSNLANGLPLGLSYDWHMVSGGLTRRFKKNLTATLSYRYYQYDEPAAGGFNDYTAHGILLAMTKTIE